MIGWGREHPVAAALIAYFLVGFLAVVLAHTDTSNQISSEAQHRLDDVKAVQVATCQQQVDGRLAVRRAFEAVILASFSNAGGTFQLAHNAVIPDAVIDELNRQLTRPNPGATPAQRAQPLFDALHHGLPLLRCTPSGAPVAEPEPTTTTTRPG